ARLDQTTRRLQVAILGQRVDRAEKNSGPPSGSHRLDCEVVVPPWPVACHDSKERCDLSSDALSALLRRASTGLCSGPSASKSKPLYGQPLFRHRNGAGEHAAPQKLCPAPQSESRVRTGNRRKEAHPTTRVATQQTPQSKRMHAAQNPTGP